MSIIKIINKGKEELFSHLMPCCWSFSPNLISRCLLFYASPLGFISLSSNIEMNPARTPYFSTNTCIVFNPCILA